MKNTFETIMAEAMRQGIIDGWTLIYYQVNGIPLDAIVNDIQKKLEQQRMTADAKQKGHHGIPC
jgi:hypothetical protein